MVILRVMFRVRGLGLALESEWGGFGQKMKSTVSLHYHMRAWYRKQWQEQHVGAVLEDSHARRTRPILPCARWQRRESKDEIDMRGLVSQSFGLGVGV